MNELATLRQHPDDDRLRQVCADALTERGDPLGELLLLGLGLSRAPTPELAARLQHLLTHERARLFGVHGDERLSWELDRGLPTGRFGHRGFFVRSEPVDQRAAINVLRFYETGVVVAASVAGTLEALRAAPGTMLQWLVPGGGAVMQGTYALDWTREAAPLRFSVSADYGGIDYQGHLIGPRLALEVHSHINGHRAHVDYELVDFLDADSRRAP